MAYMMHLPVAKWGRAFLERGVIEARFVKPVYDGETAVASAEDADGTLAIHLESRGQTCAAGTASLPASTPSVEIGNFRDTAPVVSRLPVNVMSFELDEWLGTLPRSWSGETAADYLAEVLERDPIYAREKLVHPGVLQRIMNKVLVDNAILGPWIHVGSRMQLLTTVALDDKLVARARVTGNYEKKGHRFVELDALVVANGRTAVAHCQHIAIYQPREQAAA
jgi:acyl dehydratase